MNKDNYEIYKFNDKIDKLRKIERKEARTIYKDIFKNQDERVLQLQNLVKDENIVLDFSSESLEKIEELFTKELIEHSQNDYISKIKITRKGYDNVLTPFLKSVALDIGIYITQMVIKKLPYLEWKMLANGKKEIGYQYPSLHKFKKAVPSYIVYPIYSTYFDFTSFILNDIKDNLGFMKTYNGCLNVDK